MQPLSSGNYYANVAGAHMKSEISQNNIHYFENFDDICYIILNGASLSLRWN